MQREIAWTGHHYHNTVDAAIRPSLMDSAIRNISGGAAPCRRPDELAKIIQIAWSDCGRAFPNPRTMTVPGPRREQLLRGIYEIATQVFHPWSVLTARPSDHIICRLNQGKSEWFRPGAARYFLRQMGGR